MSIVSCFKRAIEFDLLTLDTCTLVELTFRFPEHDRSSLKSVELGESILFEFALPTRGVMNPAAIRAPTKFDSTRLDLTELKCTQILKRLYHRISRDI